MIDRAEFESTLGHTQRTDERFALLGALLAKESGLGDRLVIEGGSAITIYTNGEYVSGDFDVVGGKTKIVPVLRRWGFHCDGRYWRRDDLGLMVEPGRARYVGNLARVARFDTPAGPVRLAAPEDLIVRRLVYAKGQHGAKSRKALDEAVLLWNRFQDSIDRNYLDLEVRFERVEAPFEEMIRRARAVE
jgi:hypothetical protein